VKHSWLAVVLLTACGGDDACELDTPPAAPTILSPLEGRNDIVADTNLLIELSEFSDPDVEDTHGATEVEIWSYVDGAPLTRVWHALVEAPVRSLRLEDGEQEWAMDEWTDYSIRARFADARGECATWSEWSTDRVFRTDDGSSALFDPAVIRDVYITIPPESWPLIDAEATPPGCVPYQRNYYKADLTMDGQSFPGVGIHVKGGCGSARHLDGKASFKIKLDWDDPAMPGCPGSRRLGGQKHLTLNAGVQDRTLEHERLGYEVYKELGIPSPRAATVRVHVNGAFWGVYTNVESIDRRMLERWFGSNDGMLYEGTYWCDLIPSNVPPGDEDTYCLTREFHQDACDAALPAGSDPVDYSPLRDFVNRIAAMPAGGFYPEIEEFFEFDTFLSSWAFESEIAHWDGYQFTIMNNYRVYHDPSTDRWTLISTGIDQTFSGDLDPWGVQGTLAARCLAEPDCEAAFAARLAQVNVYFASAGLDARVQAIYNQISPDVFNDPRKEYDNASYTQAHNDTVWFIQSRPTRVNEILASHGFN
jgi:hypothetical protein